jgi:hypothetical protein
VERDEDPLLSPPQSIGNADPFKAQNGLSGTEFESIVLFR